MIKTKYSEYRLTLSCFYFFMGLNFASWASRIPDIKQTLALSDGALGTVLFAIPMGQLCMMAVSGYVVNRYGSRICSKVSLALYAAALCLIAFAVDFYSLFAALFFFGAMANMLNIALNTQASAIENSMDVPSCPHSMVCGALVD